MSEDMHAIRSERGSVSNALFWAALGQGAFFAMQFGSSVLLARLLSPREMGVFAIGAATVALVSSLQALGLNNLLIRAETVDRDTLATVFTVNIVLSMIVGIVIIAIGLFSEHLFREPGTVRVMLWISVTPLLAAIGLIPSSLLQRENNFRALSVLKITSTLIGTALTVELAFAGYSYMSLAYGWVLTCAVNSLGACLLAPRHVHIAFGLRAWRNVSSFGTGMLLVNGVTQAQRQLLNLILGRFLGLEAVGLFSRANNLSSLLIENTQTVAMRVFLVDFAEAARQGLGLRDRYLKVIELMTSALWPLFAGLAVLAEPCVHLLYGPMWHNLAVPLALLSISGLFWIAVAMAWELFVVANETGRQARIETKRAVVGSLLFLIGCHFSLVIAVSTRIAETIYSIFLYRPHIARITGCSTKDLLPVYLRSAGLTLVAIAPATLLMLAYDWSPVTPPALVTASVAAGIMMWLLAILLMSHPLADQVRAVLRRLGLPIGRGGPSMRPSDAPVAYAVPDLKHQWRSGFLLNRPPRRDLVPTFPVGTTISRIIHQTYHRAPWPDALAANVAAIQAMNPTWEHRLHDYEARVRFIREVYGSEVLALYETIDERYGAARADLFRYLLLYKCGGIYLDMKSSTGRPLDEVIAANDVYLLSTWRDAVHDDYPNWGRHAEVAHLPFGEFQQWHVAAAPGHPFLKEVIERVLRNMQIYNRGLHGTGAYAVLRVTGPVAYTLAVETLLAHHPHRIVDSKRELGLVYSVFDQDSARSHEALFPHYARLRIPLIRETIAGRALSLAAQIARKAVKGARTASAALHRRRASVSKG